MQNVLHCNSNVAYNHLKDDTSSLWAPNKQPLQYDLQQHSFSGPMYDAYEHTLPTQPVLGTPESDNEPQDTKYSSSKSVFSTLSSTVSFPNTEVREQSLHNDIVTADPSVVDYGSVSVDPLSLSILSTTPPSSNVASPLYEADVCETERVGVLFATSEEVEADFLNSAISDGLVLDDFGALKDLNLENLDEALLNANFLEAVEDVSVYTVLLVFPLDCFVLIHRKWAKTLALENYHLKYRCHSLFRFLLGKLNFSQKQK